jgi:hypothetical protein
LETWFWSWTTTPLEVVFETVVEVPDSDANAGAERASVAPRDSARALKFMVISWWCLQ